MSKLIIFLATSIVVGTLVGCNAEQMAQLRLASDKATTELQEAKARLAEEARTLEEKKAAATALPASSEKDEALKDVAKQGRLVDKLTTVVAKTETAARAFNNEIKAADPSDQFAAADATIKAVSTFIPGPWGLIATLVGTNVISLLRASYNRKVAQNIARSMELVQDSNGIVNLNNPDTQNKLRAMQGAGGARVVDEAQGKATALPV